MVNLDSDAVAARFRAHEIKSLIHAFEILEQVQFFQFLVDHANHMMATSFEDKSVDELAIELTNHRQVNRILLGIPELVRIIQGADSDA